MSTTPRTKEEWIEKSREFPELEITDRVYEFDPITVVEILRSRISIEKKLQDGQITGTKASQERAKLKTAFDQHIEKVEREQ